MDRICLLFLYFFLYSVIGWVCETAYCSIGKRKFVNRGFLNGPLCPVYGFGALAVVWLLRPVCEYPILVFAAGAAVTSALEYLTGYLLEKLFGLKLWDYSKRPFNAGESACETRCCSACCPYFWWSFCTRFCTRFCKRFLRGFWMLQRLCSLFC